MKIPFEIFDYNCILYVKHYAKQTMRLHGRNYNKLIVKPLKNFPNGGKREQTSKES